MADTSVTYTGDNIETTFSIPFPYLSESHVKVEINGFNMLNPAVWYISGSSVVFRIAPADGASVKIFRQTQGDTRLVNFQNGAVLTEADLDLSADQIFYLVQEAKENWTDIVNAEILRVGGGNGIVSTDPDEIIAGLVEQILTDATALELSQRVTDIDDNASSILSLSTSLQSQINALAEGIAAIVYVQATEPVPGVGGVPDPIPDGARWYDSDDNNHPYIYDGTGVAWIDIADPRIASNAADIVTLQADLTTAQGDITGNAGLISTLNATVYDGASGVTANAAAITALSATVGSNTAAITTEQTARANGDSALAADLALIGAANGTDTAFILDTSTVKIDSDLGDTFATRLTALSASDATNAADIITEQTARISGDTVIADELHLLGAQNVAETAFILDTATVKLDSDAGVTVAAKFSSIEATNSANSASITTIQSVTIPAIESDVTTLEAKYGVTLDVNGYITGFAQNNDGSTGTFVVLADKFAVVTPGETAVVPFLISGGVVSMQNVEINGSLLVNGSILGNHIANDAITAANIDASTITATEINATNLSGLFADLGTITAGNITLDTSGYIRGGQTAYDTGTGFFLGYETSAYKFSIGDAATNSMTWDGTTLSVRGDIYVGEYTASDTTLLSATTERTNSTQGWVEEKGFTVDRAGTVRITFETKRGGPPAINVSTYPQYRVKVNGVVETTVTQTSLGYGTKTHDIAGVAVDDSITVETIGGEEDDFTTTIPVYIKNAYLKADVTIVAAGGTVTND